VGQAAAEPSKIARKVSIVSASSGRLSSRYPIKILGGPLRLPEPPANFDGLIRDARFEALPVEQRYVAVLQELPEIHDNSFDRMLVAQALVDDLDLVSGDERIPPLPGPHRLVGGDQSGVRSDADRRDAATFGLRRCRPSDR